MAVKTVGITYRNGGYAGVLGYLALAAVTHCLALVQLTYLEYGGLERADSLKRLVVNRIDTVQSQSQTDHIVMHIGEALYCGGVADMTQDMMLECSLQFIGRLVETLYLEFGEIIEFGTVTAYEMREYRTRDDRGLFLQAVYKLGHILRGESQTMHTGIYLDMYGEVGHTVMLGCTDNHIQKMETVHLGLQFVVEQGVERCTFRIHHHDAGGYARFTQLGTLIGHSHSQIIHLTVLQRLGHLDGS